MQAASMSIHSVSADTEQAQTLLSIPVGSAATVTGIRVGGAMRRRLMDLGLTAHATAWHLFDAPSGDPRAYQIRGTVIALRNADAAAVEVTLAPACDVSTVLNSAQTLPHPVTLAPACDVSAAVASPTADCAAGGNRGAEAWV